MMNDEQFKAELERRCTEYQYKQKIKHKTIIACCPIICCLILGISAAIFNFKSNNKNTIDGIIENNSYNVDINSPSEDDNIPTNNNIHVYSESAGFLPEAFVNNDLTNYKYKVLSLKFISEEICLSDSVNEQITNKQIKDIIDCITSEDNLFEYLLNSQDSEKSALYSIEIKYSNNYVYVYKNIDDKYFIVNDKYKITMSNDNIVKLQNIINSL